MIYFLFKSVQNRTTDMLYNLGVSLLFNKQPLEAFECLHQVAGVYTQNARVWLRLAESCLMSYRHSLSYENYLAKTGTTTTTTTGGSNGTTSHHQHQQFIKINSTTSANEKLFKLSEKIKCICIYK